MTNIFTVHFLFLLFSLQSVLARQAEPLKVELLNPQNMLLLDEDRLLIYDSSNEDTPVFIISLEDDQVIENKIRFGRGPGEIGKMYKTFSRGVNGNIMIYDKSLSRINIYDENLGFLQSIIPEFIKGSIMHAGFISEGIFSVMVGEKYLSFYPLHWQGEKLTIADSVASVVLNGSTPTLNGLNNFLLKQDLHFASEGDDLYIASEYGSVIQKYRKGKLMYETLEPDNYSIPEIEPDGSIYSLPDVAEYPVCALDIDVAGDFIYVLFKGEKAPKESFNKKTVNMGAILENLTHSDQVYAYRKNDGYYMGKTTLPLKAESMEISSDAVYLLSSYKQNPQVFKIGKEILDKVE